MPTFVYLYVPKVCAVHFQEVYTFSLERHGTCVSRLRLFLSVQGDIPDNPQTVILRVMEEMNYQRGEFVFDMVQYFVYQCRDTVNPFADLEADFANLVGREATSGRRGET